MLTQGVVEANYSVVSRPWYLVFQYCHTFMRILQADLANSAKLAPKTIFTHVNRNKQMGTGIQRLLHPDGSPATTDQEMIDLLNKNMSRFLSLRSTPAFHPRTEIQMANPSSQNQKSKEPPKPSTPIWEPVLMGSSRKPLKLWVPT